MFEQSETRRPWSLANWIGFAIILAVMALIIICGLGYRDRIFFFVESVPGGDLAGHFCVMGLLGFAANLVLSPRLRGSRLRAAALVSLGVCLFIAVEEGRQHFLPTRTFDPHDLLFGVMGVALAGLFYWLWVRRS